ncbi:MAG: hypothetical protein ABR562_01440 [Thermoplasmatota archaeon]|nr:hypothetical protein [Halobacteriales archaeon]
MRERKNFARPLRQGGRQRLHGANEHTSQMAVRPNSKISSGFTWISLFSQAALDQTIVGNVGALNGFPQSDDGDFNDGTVDAM